MARPGFRSESGGHLFFCEEARIAIPFIFRAPVFFSTNQIILLATNSFRVPLKTVLFREGGVSRVLKSSCIRTYIPVFRAQLPCPHKKILVF